MEKEEVRGVVVNGSPRREVAQGSGGLSLARVLGSQLPGGVAVFPCWGL